MKCLACGQENKAGEASCTACAASLDLKLCGTCEAINAQDAGRCHGCGASWSLSSAWVISGEPGPRSRAFRAALWFVPVLAAAVFTSYHYASGVAEAGQAVVFTPPVVAPAPEVAVKAVAEEPVKKARVEPPTARSRAAAIRVVPRVTHTRGPDSAAAGGTTTRAGEAGNLR